MKHFTTLLFIIIIITIACNSSNQHLNTAPIEDPITSHIDSSIAPQENFFLYANNGWFKTHPIPSSESSNGIFRTIQDTINEAIKRICESSAADTKAEKGSNKQKIGDFYFSGMDTSVIEKKGIQPLNDELTKIDAVSNLKELLDAAARLQTLQTGCLFRFNVSKDEKNSSKYVVALGQTSLGLPERDYYFNTDSRTSEIRKEYVKYISTQFQNTGMPVAEAQKNSTNIMAIETALAKASRKMEDLRDPYKNYNKMTVASLNKITPSIDWVNMLSNLGLKNVDSVVVGQPEFFAALEKELKRINLNEWKVYLKWNLIDSYSQFMNKKMADANFHFYATVLEGVKEQKPRWKKIVENTDGYLGDLLGQIYVKEYLPQGTKEKLLEIGNNIRDVFAEHIKQLDWMSAPTKEKALSKLNKIVMKVGYPDKWKDMSSLEISRDSYVQNVISINKWNYLFNINKYGKPVDKSEWSMYPQTYNAYYDPANNEICVPACNIIVPGFEGRMPDDAVLYGIIGGSTFGHEITHGFDDQGSLYDENGNLRDWWTKEDREKFIAKTKLIVEQFNNYVVLDSLHLKGENTQGENIADLGGVIMGLEAFHKTEQGKSKELINGYTPDQRYFLAYAYAWMVNKTDASLAKQVMSNEHAPSEFRINGPLSDIDAFYKAFNIKEGDRMYRPDSLRVRIW
ncbi:MAG: Neprilysin [Bacteroidetes bacterium]|jgi:putative endopeptidase|nr:Neprilysin [Bacteroidota bacterium]